ncbi:MAG: Gfo/Idh/MocA family protein [Solirubrobacteraceae bacterium]
MAVAGGGYGAKVPLPAYSELDEFEPVAVWSRHEARARELAEKAGLALATASFEELLDFPDLEAVHVATPVTMHAEMAIAAVQRGLHVLCEKPLASNVEEGRRIAAAASEAGVVCTVNYGRRMQVARTRVIERVREVVGRPRFVSISLVHDDHARPNSRPFSWVSDAELGGGRLQAYGVHDLDLLLSMFEVESVAAATEVQVPERDASDGRRTVTAEDAYAMVGRLRGGGLALVSMTAAAAHERGDLIEVHGEEGTVRLDAERRLWSGRAGEELSCEGPLEASSSDAFRGVARAFHAAVREGAEPDPSLDEALRVQALVDAMRQAAEERRWVAVSDVAAAGP